MHDSITLFLEEYGVALEHAAKLGAEESALDEERKITFSDLVSTSTEKSTQKAEHAARAHPSYRDIIARLARVREDAAVAKARCSHMQARLDVWRTRAATQRTLKAIGGPDAST